LPGALFCRNMPFMNQPLPLYRRLLNDKLVEKIEKNPKYSLRAFAKALGLDSSALSQILRGQRFLSEEKAETILDKLNLSFDERENFLNSLVRARVNAGKKRMSSAQKNRVRDVSQNLVSASRELTADVFRTVSDWYHYAILELTQVSHFENDAQWISKRLGITQPEVVSAIARLKELELLEEKDGKIFKTTFYLNTKNHSISSAALRRRQKQILEKSIYSLENHPIEIRNHSARTVAISRNKIAEAKIQIEKFMVELCDRLGSENPEDVYELSVQLFPLENLDSKGERS
jgi:uncharacterized protein (TIGR02147 family)